MIKNKIQIGGGGGGWNSIDAGDVFFWHFWMPLRFFLLQNCQLYILINLNQSMAEKHERWHAKCAYTRLFPSHQSVSYFLPAAMELINGSWCILVTLSLPEDLCPVKESCIVGWVDFRLFCERWHACCSTRLKISDMLNLFLFWTVKT